MDRTEILGLPTVQNHNGAECNNEDAIKECVRKNKYEYQDDVVEYLKSGIPYAAIPEIQHDIFTQDRIPYESVLYTDGNFKWTSDIIYYVEKYNLLLSKEFTEVAEHNKNVNMTIEELVGA
jgi:hypothetical protein